MYTRRCLPVRRRALDRRPGPFEHLRQLQLRHPQLLYEFLGENTVPPIPVLSHAPRAGGVSYDAPRRLTADYGKPPRPGPGPQIRIVPARVQYDHVQGVPRPLENIQNRLDRQRLGLEEGFGAYPHARGDEVVRSLRLDPVARVEEEARLIRLGGQPVPQTHHRVFHALEVRVHKFFHRKAQRFQDRGHVRGVVGRILESSQLYVGAVPDHQGVAWTGYRCLGGE